MGKESENDGGFSPKLLIVPAVVLCCLGPAFFVWAVGSGLFAWLAGANPVAAVAIAFAVGGAAIYLVRSRRKSGLRQEGRDALQASSRRAARSDAER